MGQKKSPTWLPGSKQAAEDAAKEYHENVRRVAVRLARHSQCERVLEQHVTQAVSSLHESGLKKRGWLWRPETEISVGYSLLGAGWGAPDVCNSVWGEGNSYSTVAVTAFVLLGTVTAIHGWMRGRG